MFKVFQNHLNYVVRTDNSCHLVLNSISLDFWSIRSIAGKPVPVIWSSNKKFCPTDNLGIVEVSGPVYRTSGQYAYELKNKDVFDVGPQTDKLGSTNLKPMCIDYESTLPSTIWTLWFFYKMRNLYHWVFKTYQPYEGP